MAYSEELAVRIREKLITQTDVEEKKMMGGLTFMLNGKMCVGIIGDELMCRIDPIIHDEVCLRDGCRTMDFTNRPMIGYILIEDRAIRKNEDFDYYMGLALEFNPKAKSSKKKKK